MVTKERIKELMELAKANETSHWLEYAYFNCSQLEYHEILFMTYSMDMAKSIKGDTINTQKSMINELEIIERLKKEGNDKIAISVKEIPKVEEIPIKTNNYVYAYTDTIDNSSVIKLIYIHFSDASTLDIDFNIFNIQHVRVAKSVEDAFDILSIAKLNGYKIIIERSSIGACVLDLIGNINAMHFISNQEMFSEAYIMFTKILKNKYSTTSFNQEATDAIASFNPECLKYENGTFKYYGKRDDERTVLLQNIMLAFYIIAK